MIISASYRTDIPTFYGEWFMNRLDAGYCLVPNPYGSRPYHASLKREDVDGIVFWTKNLGPFMDKLPIVHQRGYPFVVQYTINGYPRVLESSVVDARHAIQHMKTLADSYGPRVAVWRYDAIVFTSHTPLDFHRENFAQFARELEGTTDEVVIAFANIYQKTQRNMDWAAKQFDFVWEDPADEVKQRLANKLAQIARSHGMQLTMCGQRQFVNEAIGDAHCVDVKRLSDVAGQPIGAKEKPQREVCGCYASRDIGAYDTCPHGCVYCYAVRNRNLAKQRYRAHDPHSPFLYITGKYAETTPIQQDETQPRLL